MGIKQLMNLVNEKASGAIRKEALEHYSGRVIACDASMAIYQFVIATQFTSQRGVSMLTDDAGNPTAHLVGIFNRTVQFLEVGIKPVWVFDGKPPDLKNGELDKRRKRRDEATELMRQAQEYGNVEDAKKYAQRAVNVTRDMTEDAKLLLTLLGIPIVESAGEAEAQCAELVKSKKAYAVASEDMDSLTFGANYLLRGFNTKKEPIVQISLEDILRDLDLRMHEFVDMCILLGCDYCANISGIGPVTGLKLIKQFGSIERVIDHVANSEKKKYSLPTTFNFEAARALFLHPDVIPGADLNLEWKPPSEEQLRNFLIVSKGFASVRVEQGLKRIKCTQGRPTQTRLESFFKESQVIKRKPPEPPKKKSKMMKKSRGGFLFRR